MDQSPLCRAPPRVDARCCQFAQLIPCFFFFDAYRTILLKFHSPFFILLFILSFVSLSPSHTRHASMVHFVSFFFILLFFFSQTKKKKNTIVQIHYILKMAA
ncbi:hypothetical protein BC940DRAFT_299623 [Gongronella butleri]|nr:hypothetical protein BC940DRAFT_299623 [Gongronella butleri]